MRRPDLLEGLMFIVANWGVKGQETIIDAVQEEDRRALDHAGFGLAGYGDIWIFKEALERAGVADKVKVRRGDPHRWS